MKPIGGTLREVGTSFATALAAVGKRCMLLSPNKVEYLEITWAIHVPKEWKTGRGVWYYVAANCFWIASEVLR
jgi:hypothetical protein